MVLSAARAPVAAPTGRFAAFSFVDQITQIQGVTRACGLYTIPANIEHFPASLTAEALGQLAAWVGMSALGFSHRPVAALAGDTKIFSLPKPGDTLELIVDIESCDAESILYRGHALVSGRLVLELADTVGSMLDISEFDDPVALAADFAQLSTTGRAVGAFKGVARAALMDLPASTPEHLQAQLAVPAQAAFFEDHFPRRPVFPATLLLVAVSPARGRPSRRRRVAAPHAYYQCQGACVYGARCHLGAVGSIGSAWLRRPRTLHGQADCSGRG